MGASALQLRRGSPLQYANARAPLSTWNAGVDSRWIQSEVKVQLERHPIDVVSLAGVV
jgi:hypothetical protein